MTGVSSSGSFFGQCTRNKNEVLQFLLPAAKLADVEMVNAGGTVVSRYSVTNLGALMVVRKAFESATKPARGIVCFEDEFLRCGVRGGWSNKSGRGNGFASRENGGTPLNDRQKTDKLSRKKRHAVGDA